jgi:hypothetical protein
MIVPVFLPLTALSKLSAYLFSLLRDSAFEGGQHCQRPGSQKFEICCLDGSISSV